MGKCSIVLSQRSSAFSLLFLSSSIPIPRMCIHIILQMLWQRFCPNHLRVRLPCFATGLIVAINVMAELWGSMVVSVLFWGLANRIMSVREAKRYYPFFGIGANIALIVGGLFVQVIADITAALPEGINKFGVGLKFQ